MEVSLVHGISLLLVGVAGGFANSVAGGASLMSMPALLMCGLPLQAALATNKLATTGQSIFTAFRYRQGGYFSLKTWTSAALPALLGASLGALIVLELPQWVLQLVVGVVLCLALGLTLFAPRVKEGEVVETGRKYSMGTSWVAMGGIGVYGGFFGGGVGLVLVPVLNRFYGLDFLRANGVKSGLAAVMNFTALAIFLVGGGVEFAYGGILLLGMLLGAYFGVNVAINKGEKWVRVALVVATIASLFILGGRAFGVL